LEVSEASSLILLLKVAFSMTNVEHWWKETDKNKQEYSKQNPSQGHFIYLTHDKELCGTVSRVASSQNFGFHRAVTDKTPLKKR
jgi:hypothetical protein